MEINNFDLIKSHLHFNSEDDFYFLQILQRPKDGNNIRGNNKNRLVKYYIIRSEDSFKKYEKEIIDLCQLFNARAYIHPTKRSFKEVAKIHIKNIIDTYTSENYISLGKEYTSACGQSWVSEDKKFVLDIDTPYSLELELLLSELLKNCNPVGKNKIVYRVPTLNGFHLICTPFDTYKFCQDLIINKLNIDIHKNNPTLLYYFKV